MVDPNGVSVDEVLPGPIVRYFVFLIKPFKEDPDTGVSPPVFNCSYAAFGSRIYVSLKIY